MPHKFTKAFTGNVDSEAVVAGKKNAHRANGCLK
jgi:hypothetical protein